MTPESLSDQIATVAALILGAICLFTAWNVFFAWRSSRSSDRMATRMVEMSQQLHAVTDRLQRPESPIRKGRELPPA